MGKYYDTSIFGGLLLFLIEHNINSKQWAILKPYVRKSQERRALLEGPLPRIPNLCFEKYNILVHNYKLDPIKFLIPVSSNLKTCSELRNRALFGSAVNADVASYLKWDPQATAYKIAKATHNHKARVFEIHLDIKLAL